MRRLSFSFAHRASKRRAAASYSSYPNRKRTHDFGLESRIGVNALLSDVYHSIYGRREGRAACNRRTVGMEKSSGSVIILL